MSRYKSIVTGDTREINDEVVALWRSTGNPKADYWVPYVEPLPVTAEPTRADYKRAIDDMLQAQCARYEFDGPDALAKYFPPIESKFQAKALWVARLCVFAWATSDDMASAPPTDNPPTPAQLAAYLLATFSANDPAP